MIEVVVLLTEDDVVVIVVVDMVDVSVPVVLETEVVVEEIVVVVTDVVVSVPVVVEMVVDETVVDDRVVLLSVMVVVDAEVLVCVKVVLVLVNVVELTVVVVDVLVTVVVVLEMVVVVLLIGVLHASRCTIGSNLGESSGRPRPPIIAFAIVAVHACIVAPVLGTRFATAVSTIAASFTVVEDVSVQNSISASFGATVMCTEKFERKAAIL